jgi:HSP20 family protein
MSLIKKNRGFFPSQSGDLFLNKLFDPDFMNFNTNFWEERFKTPLANIDETADKFKIDLSAPGLKKEDFKVEVDKGMLIISCEKKEDVNENKEDYKRREFSYTSFSRSFQLPDNVKEEDINAKYDNGILSISIPKKEISAPKQKKAIQVG